MCLLVSLSNEKLQLRQQFLILANVSSLNLLIVLAPGASERLQPQSSDLSDPIQ